MFHLRDGLFFDSLPDGQVRIRKSVEVEAGSAHGGSSQLVFDVTLSANEWASVIASMREDYGFYRALNFHRGDPIDETTPLVDKLPPGEVQP